MSALVFEKHDRVRVTAGEHLDETGTIAEDVPLTNSRAMAYARVLLDGHDHGGAVYIPWADLKRLPVIDLTVVRNGIDFVGNELDSLVGKPYPDQTAVVHVIDRLRRVVENLAVEVEKIAEAVNDR